MRIKIQTSLGDIIVRLYDETPRHRDNFVKLAKEGYFDGTLFHRVIKDFMIPSTTNTRCLVKWRRDSTWWSRFRTWPREEMIDQWTTW